MGSSGSGIATTSYLLRTSVASTRSFSKLGPDGPEYCCDFVPEGISAKDCRHLVVMLHGLGGNSSDWHAVLDAFQRHWDFGSGILVLRTNVPSVEMSNGIKHTAQLVLMIVKEVLQSNFATGHDLDCSLVTLSFGALYGRYLVKLLVDEGLLYDSAPAKPNHWHMRPRTFISIASPHLGVRWASPESRWAWCCHTALSQVGGKAIEELLLEDKPPHILCSLAQDEFITALEMFRSRVCYANVFHDIQVPFFTAAIEYNNPFEHCEPSELIRLKGFESIIDTVAMRSNVWPGRDSAYFACDPQKEQLALMRENLHELGWRKICCLLPAIPNAHNAIVGNSSVASQGRDVADHIASTALQPHLESLESFLGSASLKFAIGEPFDSARSVLDHKLRDDRQWPEHELRRPNTATW